MKKQCGNCKSFENLGMGNNYGTCENTESEEFAYTVGTQDECKEFKPIYEEEEVRL